MKNNIIKWSLASLGLIAVIFVFIYLDKPKPPIVSSDGTIEGNYSIANIMALKKPYKCSFENKDEASLVKGDIYTQGSKIYGEFRIKTSSLPEDFSTFLIADEKNSYTWTSLVPLGYKSSIARSASGSADPLEQAQILGTRDKIHFSCKPFSQIDETMFNPPSNISFKEY